jgi:hypothetical protein
MCALTVTPTTPPERTIDQALDHLEEMVGLAPVKEEVNKLNAALEVERMRREEGLAIAPISFHMVFTGPPGVGKTEVARARRDLSLAQRAADRPPGRDRPVGPGGEVYRPDRPQDALKEALDGILFIDEAYSLPTGRPRISAVSGSTRCSNSWKTTATASSSSQATRTRCARSSIRIRDSRAALPRRLRFLPTPPTSSL